MVTLDWQRLRKLRKLRLLCLLPLMKRRGTELDGDWLDDANDAIATAQLAPALYMFCQGIVQEVLHAEMPNAQDRCAA